MINVLSVRVRNKSRAIKRSRRNQTTTWVEYSIQVARYTRLYGEAPNIVRGTDFEYILIVVILLETSM